MTRHQLMRRMSGEEFAAWAALFKIHGEEAEHARLRAESKDGIVLVNGLPLGMVAEEIPAPTLEEVIDDRGWETE